MAGQTSRKATRQRQDEGMSFGFVCPLCRDPLQQTAATTYVCPRDKQRYHSVDGIWRFLPPPLAARYEHFITSYETIRLAEGWGSATATDYRALPFTYGSGPYRDVWRIRVGSYQALVARIVTPLAHTRQKPLRVLDLGAGTGWLSYRLAGMGHRSAAVDLIVNDWDGLGAWKYYAPSPPFLPVQAAFEHLPFTEASSDLVIFNGAIHYARDYTATLQEVCRLLRPGGQIVIMDSPFYRQDRSGMQMVQEKAAVFQETHGIDLDTLPAENYLTPRHLDRLSRELGIKWHLIRPFRGIRWTIRGWRHRLRRRRAPATFPLIVGAP